MIDREELARVAIDCGIKIHQDLGPGLLESVYELLLTAMLVERGLLVQRQKPIDIVYRGLSFKDAFRIDIMVQESLIIEVKSIARCGAVTESSCSPISG